MISIQHENWNETLRSFCSSLNMQSPDVPVALLGRNLESDRATLSSMGIPVDKPKSWTGGISILSLSIMVTFHYCGMTESVMSSKF